MCIPGGIVVPGADVVEVVLGDVDGVVVVAGVVVVLAGAAVVLGAWVVVGA
jgi:hypothetical protein